MKNISKPCAIFISLALSLAFLISPAFSGMVLRARNSAMVPAVRSLPLNPVGVAGSLRSSLSQRITFTGSAILPQAAIAPAAPLSAELPAFAAEAEVAAPRQGVISRVARAVAGKLSFGRLFDNSRAAAPGAIAGFLPINSDAPQGVVLDKAPSAPNPSRVSGVAIEDYELPGIFNTGDDIFTSGPTVLAADPADEADMERALRSVIDGDPMKYRVTSAQLKTVHVRRVPGVGEQADTIYAVFRQQKDGLEVHGSFLSFTVKVLQDHPVIMASMAKLYPTPAVSTVPRIPEEELKEKALERLGRFGQLYGVNATFIERKIIFMRGDWHAANIYMIEGGPHPIAIAVDVVSGQAFAWDPRAGTISAELRTRAATSGHIVGKTVEKGPTMPDSKLVPVPLPDLAVNFGNGKTVFTDAEGRFTAPKGLDAQGKRFEVTLTGAFARVGNSAGDTLQATGVLEDGKEVTVSFDPTGMSEEDIAQINGYLLTTQVHDWAKSRGLNDWRLDMAIPVSVNIDDECNAYYTPMWPSLNFFKSSDNCVNSAYDTVVKHEYGHFIDDMLGGIVNGGLSEGWGDIFSMYMLDNPIIGEHFLKNPVDGVDYIRSGENTYYYDPGDEVHKQGQAWGGFAWKLRKALIEKFGYEAGTALAEALVVPTLLAKAHNIPAAMAQVLLSDMDKNGALPHEAEIRAAAQAHGVTLPANPGRILAFAKRLTGLMMQYIRGQA